MVELWMIEHDLENSGFEVRENLSGGLLVSLSSRPVGASEVRTALHDRGYDDCQFKAYKLAYSHEVIVEAVVG